MKEIAGYPGYFVSEDGRIWSAKRNIWLAPHKTDLGYTSVLLCHKGKARHKLIHRLVAKAFIPNPSNKRTVNHKNGIKTDNRIENLEWATHSENNLHRYRVLKCKPSITTAKLTEDQVREISKSLDTGMSRRELALKFGVGKPTIDKIAWGQRWSHVTGR